MTPDDVLDIFKECGAFSEGHFILASGLHSPVFFRKNLVFMHPAINEKLCSELARRIRAKVGEVDLVLTPAVGGLLPAYETARHLGCPMIYVERENDRFQLRRGFSIPKGARVAFVEDVVTTGDLSLEVFALIEQLGGKVACAAYVLDRLVNPVRHDVPIVSLARMDIPAYADDEVPPELAALPVDDPGSRRLGSMRAAGNGSAS